MSKTETLILYISIIFVTFILGCNSQKRKILTIGVDLTIFNKFSFFLAFLISWFFFAFAGMSNDYTEYQHIFDVSNIDNFNSLWIEPGYALLNAIIKLFIPNSQIAIIIIKTIILSLIYKVIYDYRKKVPVGLSLFAYMGLAYLDAFCMLRIHLAAALVLLAIDFYDNYNKKICPFVLILCAISIHYSTFIFILVILSYFACARRNRVSIVLFMTLVVVLVLSNLIAVPLLRFLTTHVVILEKYGRKYSTINAAGSGLMQYVYHLPFLLVFYDCWNRINNRNAEDSRLLKIGLILTPCSLFFGTMGYKFEVIGRSYVFFLFIWMIVLPRYYEIKRKEKKEDWIIAGSLVVFWILLRLYIYIQSGSLSSSGIERYIFVWSIH